MRVIGYTYEAAYHCVDCTSKAFNLALDNNEDSEGNPIHPVFSTDEISPHETCDDCGEELDA